jgi:transcriptional regulator with XRE-family HTH domain
MNGQELRNKLLGKGVVLSDLADQLGMSPQVLSARFNVKNLKLDFIREVEKIVGFPIIEDTTAPHPLSGVDALIGLLQKKDEQMDRLIALLEQRYSTDDKKERRAG